MSLARVLVVVVAVVGALTGCAPRQPLEPLEPLSPEDLEPLPDPERPGQIIEIPLEREPSGTAEPAPIAPDDTVPSGWDIRYRINLQRGDYKITSGRGLMMYECRRACAEDVLCKAFTYRKPVERGKPAFCTLKDEVTRPIPCLECTTGVKPGAGPP